MAATTFRPSTAQLVVSVCVALAAVAAAFGMPRAGAGAAPAESPVSRLGLIGLVVAFVCLSVFQLGHEAGPPWFACTVMLVALVVLGTVVLRWRFPAGGLGAGAVLVYVWVGLANAAEHGAGSVAEQAVLVALVLAALVAFALHRHRLDLGVVSERTTTPIA